MEQLKIRISLADREKKMELGELKKQLRSEKLGLSEGEIKTELGGNDRENKTELIELKKQLRSEKLGLLLHVDTDREGSPHNVLHSSSLYLLTC